MNDEILENSLDAKVDERCGYYLKNSTYGYKEFVFDMVFPLIPGSTFLMQKVKYFSERDACESRADLDLIAAGENGKKVVAYRESSDTAAIFLNLLTESLYLMGGYNLYEGAHSGSSQALFTGLITSVPLLLKVSSYFNSKNQINENRICAQAARDVAKEIELKYNSENVQESS